jgi:hypothetical protein
MPTFEQLTGLRLAGLDTAIDDWERTVRDLRDLAEEARTGLRARTAEAGWAGVNADVSQQYVYVTATQFTYAKEQAEAVHAVLRDVREAFGRYQRDLRALAEEARAQRLLIRGDGVVVATDGDLAELGETYLDSVPPWQLPDGGQPGDRQADIETMAARVQAVLDAAAETDAVAERALRELSGDGRDVFAPPGPAGLAHAEWAQGTADAREALRLIGSGAAETEEGLARLNELVGAQRNNEHFAAYLADHLGGAGILDFWATTLHDDNHPEPTTAYRDGVRQLRENLGIALGTATRAAGGDGLTDWERELVDLGTDRFGPTREDYSPYGFQLMSDLMGHGAYDGSFLQSYGAALVTAERREGLDAAAFWTRSVEAGDSYRHLVGDDFRLDPATGFLTALSANPEAATRFFGTYEADLTLENDPNRFNDEEGYEEDRSVGQDYASYFLRDRAFDTGVDELHPDTGGNAAREALGDALFAATTGMSATDPAAVPLPEHTEEQRQLLDTVLRYEAALGNDLPQELRDSNARILADYRSEVFDTSRNPLGSELPLDGADLAVVNAQISRDPGAYQVVSQAMAVEYVERLHGAAGGDPEAVLTDIGYSMGFLEQGRFAALEIDRANTPWTATVIGEGAYLLGEIPLVGPHLQTVTEHVLDSWTAHQQNVTGGGLEESYYDYYGESNSYLRELAAQWSESNPGTELRHAEQTIREAAHDGDREAIHLLGEARVIDGPVTE